MRRFNESQATSVHRASAHRRHTHRLPMLDWVCRYRSAPPGSPRSSLVTLLSAPLQKSQAGVLFCRIRSDMRANILLFALCCPIYPPVELVIYRGSRPLMEVVLNDACAGNIGGGIQSKKFHGYRIKQTGRDFIARHACSLPPLRVYWRGIACVTFERIAGESATGWYGGKWIVDLIGQFREVSFAHGIGGNCRGSGIGPTLSQTLVGSIEKQTTTS
jgi:hypothetical protein